MKTTITNRQMYFILMLGLFRTLEMSKNLAQTSGRSGWAFIIVASLIFGIAGVIIAKLNSMYENKVFFDYSQEISGKFLAYLFAFYYIIYYFYMGNYLIKALIDLISSNFFSKTPQSLLAFFGILTFIYVSYKGVQNIAKLAEFLGVLVVITSFFILTSMFLTGTKENILPIFNMKELNFETLKYLIAPYGGIEFLLVISFTNINKKACKAVFLIILFIGLFYIAIVQANIITIGINNTMVLNDSFIEAMRIVEVPIVERMDILFLIVYFIYVSFSFILIYTAITEFACKIMPKIKRPILSVSIGIIAYFLYLFTKNIKNINNINEAIIPYIVIISSIIIPITVLITAKIKKAIKKGEGVINE